MISLILDPSESEAIALAEELGIKITGTIGILLQAYDENMLTAQDIMTCIDKLKENNIRISERLYNLVTDYISKS